jgi:molybdate transport system regulatory protein
MLKKTEKPGVHFKLWLSSGRVSGVFGDGKWRLLEAIEKEGSLRAAVGKLGISYRKAWGDLKKSESALGVSLVEKHRGGSKGGGSGLTEEGRKLLAAYGRFRRDIEKGATKAFEKHIKGLLG